MTKNETELYKFTTKSMYYLSIKDDNKGVTSDLVVLPIEIDFDFYAGTK